MSEKKHYRALNFDLRIEDLRMYYSSRYPKQAYREIKKYLLSNGFSHRQWSGYKSKVKLGDYELLSLIDRMFLKFPWLEKCATKFDVTNIGRTYDLLSMRIADKKAEKGLSTQPVQQTHHVEASPKPEPVIKNSDSQHKKKIQR